MNLKYLTDKQLINDTSTLILKERKATAELLFHLKEIERRKLFSELGFPSLFKYLVSAHGYSEAAAIRRVEASRLLEDVPEIQEKIENGSLSLSNIARAAEKMKESNIKDPSLKKEIIAAIENTSTRTCEKILEDIIVPGQLPIERTPVMHPILFSEENFRKFSYLRDLLAHKKLNRDAILSKILDVATKRLEQERFRIESTAEEKESDSRYIPAGMKKIIFERDKICTQCGSTYALEIDHIKPYALGGKTTKKNLRLLCRNCNQRARISSNLQVPYK